MQWGLTWGCRSGFEWNVETALRPSSLRMEEKNATRVSHLRLAHQYKKEGLYDVQRLTPDVPVAGTQFRKRGFLERRLAVVDFFV